MKAIIDRINCIGCGLCVAVCPQVFVLSEDGTAEVYVDEVEENLSEAVYEAVDGCPVSVISVEQ